MGRILFLVIGIVFLAVGKVFLVSLWLFLAVEVYSSRLVNLIFSHVNYACCFILSFCPA